MENNRTRLDLTKLEKVILKNEDKLSNIEYIEFDGNKYYVKYNTGTTIYRYTILDVVIVEKNDVFSYLKKIAGTVKLTEEFSLLEKFYNDVQLRKGSLMRKYLEKGEIEQKENKYNLLMPFGFNKSQYAATENSFSFELSVIEGPPGTGKTNTIMNIISNIIYNGKTVAVVSNNIAAVENVKDKLLEKGYDFLQAYLGDTKSRESFFSDFSKKREINPKWQLDSKQFEYYTNRINMLTKVIRQLLDDENQLFKDKEKLKQYEFEQKHYDEFYSMTDEYNGNFSFLKLDQKRIIAFIIDSYVREGDKKRGFLDKLKLLFKYGCYKFKEFEDNELAIIQKYHKDYYDNKINELKARIKDLSKKLEKESFEEYKKEHYVVSESLFKHYLYGKYSFDRKMYDVENYKKKFDDFVTDFPIVLSTTYSLTSTKPAHKKYDYVIVDESSTVDVVKGALALDAGNNIILVGDLKQLSHIPIKTTIGAPDPLYDQKKNLLESVKGVFGEQLKCTLLREHYRCHPDIIRFCNKKFYNDELIVFNSNNHENALFAVKTVKGNHARFYNNSTAINYREVEEAEVILNDIRDEISEMDTKYKEAIGKDSSCGFATPYRKQVRAATDALDDITCDTIHKFQGREKDVIFFSTVLDKKSLSERNMKFVTDPRLVNVAVSRAKKHLFVLTTGEVFMKSGNHIGDLIKYIEYLSFDNIIQGKVISHFDLLYSDFSPKLIAVRDRLLKSKNPSKYKSENIVNAIIDSILKEEVFESLSYSRQVRLNHIVKEYDELSEDEKRFVKNNSSIDFSIINKYDRKPVVAIEVDGFAFHELDEKQKRRDELKDNIFKKIGVPLERFRTDISITDEKVRQVLLKHVDESVLS